MWFIFANLSAELNTQKLLLSYKKMKKNKLINLFKVGVLLFGISLLLWNCEKDSETIQPIEETIDFTLKPKIENFSLSQLNQDKDFNNLKDNFNILQTKYLSKNNKNSSARLVDTLGITIDANSIKRISYDNYVSYTMLMIEPENTSHNFSNLVIQEYNGVKRIFTVRYLPRQNKSKSNTYASKSSVESFNGDIQMSSGITTTELWGDDDGGGGGASGTSNCEEYETVCNTVNVWSSVCGEPAAHPPGVFCTSKVPRIDWVQTIEECEDICIWDNYNDQTGDNNNNSTGSGGNTGSNNNSDPTNVATTPVDPNGTVIDDIIDNTDNVCVSNIIEKLQEKDKYKSLVPDLEGISHLSQIVLDLFGECKNYDLEIKIDELGTGPNGGQINAETKGIESITLDEDLIEDATKLSIAKTLIHESMHVFINFKINKRDLKSDFYKSLEEYYSKYNTGNLAQHQFMSQFVDALAYSISAYDNHTQDISYYTKLSWGGLEQSDTYKAFTESEKNEIQKIIKNERDAKKDAKSTKC